MSTTGEESGGSARPSESDPTERPARRGVSRRDLIRRSAIIGGLAWTTPVIIDSMASPAAAASGGYTCSHINVVYTYGGSTYAAKFTVGTSTCTGNTTSNDGTFSTSCNGVTYSNTCSGTAICADGSPIASDASCSSRVTWTGGTTITAINGATIIFAVAHDGSYQGTYGSKFVPICPGSPSPNNSVTAPSCS